MRIPFILSLLPFLLNVAVVACPDSIRRIIPDTTLFNTDFEEAAFLEFTTDSIKDPLMMLLAINSGSDSEELVRLKNHISSMANNLLAKTAKQKQPAKAYKIIFDDIHSTYLKKYSLVANLGEIFQDGTYNCVSASAFYSLVLSKMNIHHVIKETVDHVYVIADPDNSQFLFETTDPAGGYWEIDDQFRKDYVDFLLKQKIITQTELNNSTIEKVFEKYYYQDESIDIMKLAGLQYYNEGIEALSKSDLTAALKSFEKAHFLYPSDRTRFLINSCLANQIDQRTDYNQSFATALIKLLNYNDSDYFKNQATGFFEQLSEDVLIKKNKPEEYDKLFQLFDKGIEDDAIGVEIEGIYYYYKGLALYYKGSYRDALPKFKEAYELQPENLKLQGIITDCVIRVVALQIDPERIIKSLDDYMMQFSFLKTQKLINDLYAKMFLGMAGNYFQINDKKNGLLYLSKFTTYKANIPDLAYDDMAVGHAYGQASSYFVRQGDYPKAKAYLEEGLKLSPLSQELNRKLQVLKDNR